MERVLVIGLDGATFDVIQPLIDEGRLPVLAGLMRDGVCGVLESTIPPLSPPAWASFLTGKNPGKHGVFEFRMRGREGYAGELVDSSLIRARKIWELLGSRNRRTVAVGVPMTYPPEPLDGLLISGIPAPSEEFPFTWPPELRAEILEVCGDYFHERQMIREMSLAGRMGKLFQHTEARKRAVQHLMREYDWDLSMVVFRSTDIVQHAALRFWRRPGHPLRHLVTQCYEHVDRVIGELIGDLPSGVAVIIMSDHGASPCDKVFYVNRWLAEEGLLKIRAFRRLRGIRRGRTDISVAALLRRFHLRSVCSRLPVAWRTKYLRFPIDREMEAGVDWPRTRAYAPLSGFAEAIDVNLEGRDGCGSVRADEYERTRNEIVRALGSVCDPDTGERVGIQARKREDVYRGPFVPEAHDLILEFTDRVYRAEGWVGARHAFGQPRYLPAQHAARGVLFLQGRQIRQAGRVDGARLVDLGPTMLYLLGLPIPSDLDGRVLEQAIDRGHRATNPPRIERVAPEEVVEKAPTGTLSREEKEKIRENLRDLGYV